VKRQATTIVVMLALLGAHGAQAAAAWVEGKHYVAVVPLGGQPLPAGQKEVVEVFSYGCPACAQFNPIARQLQQTLPKGVRFTYIPASFNPPEDWPMFQRAFFAAQQLGIAEKTHDAMFDAVWKGGELAIMDPASGRLKDPLPTIETAARFYSRQTGVKVADFVAVANSFTIEMKMKDADAFVHSYQVLLTPTIVVNRKYRTDARSAGGYPQLIELVTWLVAKDGS